MCYIVFAVVSLVCSGVVFLFNAGVPKLYQTIKL